MARRAFECIPTWSEIPVTIFAQDLDEAGQVYRDWVNAHHEGKSAIPAVMYPFGEDRLSERLLLDTAAALDRVGIGYWSPKTHSWMICAPQDRAAGDLAPPEGRVGFYQVIAEPGDDAKVFATSFEEATTLYCAWHLDAWGSLPERFCIGKRSRWELMGEQATLRDGLDAELIGVGARDNDGALRILPPDWEPIIARE